MAFLQQGKGLGVCAFGPVLRPAVLGSGWWSIEGNCPGEANLKASGQAQQYGTPGLPLGVVVSILCAVCPLSILLLFVMKLVNWLLGQLISRGLFVLHTLMLFNSKFLIKRKVLLEARELQQDPG